jgi:hypothetical protein
LGSDQSGGGNAAGWQPHTLQGARKAASQPDGWIAEILIAVAAVAGAFILYKNFHHSAAWNRGYQKGQFLRGLYVAMMGDASELDPATLCGSCSGDEYNGCIAGARG